jgi:hypothetical protein
MKNNIEHYDTSDYPLGNIYNTLVANEEVLGIIKMNSMVG